MPKIMHEILSRSAEMDKSILVILRREENLLVQFGQRQWWKKRDGTIILGRYNRLQQYEEQTQKKLPKYKVSKIQCNYYNEMEIATTEIREIFRERTPTALAMTKHIMEDLSESKPGTRHSLDWLGNGREDHNTKYRVVYERSLKL